VSAVRMLLILNDPPYGSERSYNGLRLAYALAKREQAEVRVFLLADAVGCAMAGQRVPEGYYNLGRMVEALGRRGAEVGLCGTCMDARGMADASVLSGAHRSTLEELADWTLWAERVLVF
jgi:uncharacterized protein involved in oxidation of intracellular sulfur